jgi:glyoxylase-like metal-dependent hydrolase (beta-lactamase superfamily II)
MDTHSFTYVVHDEKTRDAIVIDPVLGGTHKEFIEVCELRLKGILETHVHADHLTDAPELKAKFKDAPVFIGNLTFKDFEVRNFGSIQVKAIPTPGHTQSCMSYLIGENVFTGDSLFMPDFGTGRCDFPGGSSQMLFNSITKNLYTLPDATKVFVAHDYCPNGRDLLFHTTIGESKATNKHIKAGTSEEDFVKFRDARDKTLEPPKDIEKNVKFNTTYKCD